MAGAACARHPMAPEEPLGSSSDSRGAGRGPGGTPGALRSIIRPRHPRPYPV